MAGISEITRLNFLFKNGKDLQKQKNTTKPKNDEQLIVRTT